MHICNGWFTQGGQYDIAGNLVTRERNGRSSVRDPYLAWIRARKDAVSTVRYHSGAADIFLKIPIHFTCSFLQVRRKTRIVIRIVLTNEIPGADSRAGRQRSPYIVVTDLDLMAVRRNVARRNWTRRSANGTGDDGHYAALLLLIA
jgi:hypothetical protein